MHGEPLRIGTDEWSELGRHDWDSSEELARSLERALASLDGVEDFVVYQYIDVEALRSAFGPRRDERGIHEIRFDCERYEIRIDRDGTIMARAAPEN